MTTEARRRLAALLDRLDGIRARGTLEQAAEWDNDAAQFLAERGRALLAEGQEREEPAWWKLVPVEPTETMLDAVKLDHPIGDGETGKMIRRLKREDWRTMVAAAPMTPSAADPNAPVTPETPLTRAAISNGWLHEGTTVAEFCRRLERELIATAEQLAAERATREGENAEWQYGIYQAESRFKVAEELAKQLHVRVSENCTNREALDTIARLLSAICGGTPNGG